MIKVYFSLEKLQTSLDLENSSTNASKIRADEVSFKAHSRFHWTPDIASLWFPTLIFLNGPNPASFIYYFLSFQTNIITIFITNICEKCPSSIRCRDLNPWPSKNESSPITTRPVFGNFWRFIQYLAKIWTYSGKGLKLLGTFSLCKRPNIEKLISHLVTLLGSYIHPFRHSMGYR